MVRALIRWRMGEDHVGIRPTHGVQDLSARLVRIKKPFVVVAEEADLGIIGLRGLEHFRFARLTDEVDIRHHV